MWYDLYDEKSLDVARNTCSQFENSIISQLMKWGRTAVYRNTVHDITFCTFRALLTTQASPPAHVMKVSYKYQGSTNIRARLSFFKVELHQWATLPKCFWKYDNRLNFTHSKFVNAHHFSILGLAVISLRTVLLFSTDVSEVAFL